MEREAEESAEKKVQEAERKALDKDAKGWRTLDLKYLPKALAVIFLTT
jgi:hypothetical protein